MTLIRAIIVALLVAQTLPSRVSFAQENKPTEKTFVKTYQDLLALLRKDAVKHQAQEGEVVLIPTARGPIKDSLMVVRWSSKDGVLHFIQPIPIKVEAERVGPLSRAILRLNHAQPIPGLGLSPKGPTPYFRMTIPFQPRGQLDNNEIRAYFSTTLSQAARWHDLLKGVIDGKIDPEKVVEVYNKSRQTPPPKGRFAREAMGAKWEIQFLADGKVAVLRDGKTVVNSTAQFENDRVLFQDKDGDMATKELGVYRFALKDGRLVFKAIKDEAGGRVALLSSGPWAKVK